MNLNNANFWSFKQKIKPLSLRIVFYIINFKPFIMKHVLQSITLMILCTLFTNSIQAATHSKPFVKPGGWELLGTRTVKYGLDRDEINVTAREGFFTALKIKVNRSALNLHKMIIHFGDGSTEEVELRNNFRAGQESRVIDLPGNRRIISKVVFWYDTKNLRKSRAVVELWGRH
jgi:hypothetical protein